MSRFALAAMKCVLAQLLLRLDMTAQFARVDIPQTSVGAIARAAHPCTVHYTKRPGPA